MWYNACSTDKATISRILRVHRAVPGRNADPERKRPDADMRGEALELQSARRFHSHRRQYMQGA